MKKILLVLISVLGFFGSYGQTTVTFKPNATIGKDASIMKFDNNCIGNGDSITPANRNYGTEQIMSMKDWTWNGVGCSGGTLRSLLCFTELNSIPSNAIILNAELRLYGTNLDRNTSYPSAPSGFYSNEVIVQEITSAWNENTVTWNNPPTTTTANQFTIPASTSEYNWNYTNNSNQLVTMVQNMVSGNNYGFMLKLQTEAHYRNMIFASSDHPNADLHPELVVTYEACDANFSYCVVNNGTDSLQYTFTANNPNGGSHQWIYNGNIVSTSSTYTCTFLNYQNEGLSHKLITDSDTCECVVKVMSSFGFSMKGELQKNKMTEVCLDVPQGNIPLADKYIEPQIIISPNPTKTAWNISIKSETEDKIKITIFDINGNRIHSQNAVIMNGNNNLKVNCSNYANGLYLISIKGNIINFEKNIIKER